MCRLMRVLLVLSAALAGCGGEYVLTAPEQVAPAGEQARTVVRLQQRDVLFLKPAVREAPLSFTVADGPLRAAYTDSDGYAALNVPVPDEPGLYDLYIDYQDDFGEELSKSVPLYVWDRDAEIVAVDLDCLPGLESDGSAVEALQAVEEDGESGDLLRLPPAFQALHTIAQDAKILYMTQADISEHAEIGRRLREQRWPEGPVLLWQYRGWSVSEGPWRLPSIEFEDRWVHQLEVLREDFPNLRIGICCDERAAKILTEAGLEAVLVGDADVPDDYYTRRTTWSELAETGL